MKIEPFQEFSESVAADAVTSQRTTEESIINDG